MMRGFEDMTYNKMLIEFVLFNLDKRRFREKMRSLLRKTQENDRLLFLAPERKRRINWVNLQIKVRGKDLKAYQTVNHWNKLPTYIFFLGVLIKFAKCLTNK